ncbi:hypothetical protein Vadar_015513 [Vaccinium darrowii]|nr:hypothetical protein Vadar_015513 [Vaccinium darrowii]
MAAIARLHLLRPPPSAVSTSLLYFNLHRPSSFSNPNYILHNTRIRKLSFTPPLCSNSDSILEGSSNSGSSASIVGDLLDYLNESWTQFHATATKLEDTSLDPKDKSNISKAAHHPLLMQILSDELCCGIEDIASVELNVCDTQPSCLGGANNEFIFSGRLDNLASSYCALRALVDSCGTPGDLKSEHAIRMIALFDNEEVGSESAQGAGAPTMFEAMRWIVSCLAQEYVEGAFERAIHHSFLVSADMAHGVHPNFIDKHEEHHRPELQKGLVIKHNANQRYATSGVTAFLFKEVARIHNLPTQEFVVRNDMGCGSTIGPILECGSYVLFHNL